MVQNSVFFQGSSQNVLWKSSYHILVVTTL